MSIPERQPLLTVPQAAALLSISQRKAWELVAGGELPRVRIGRAVRIDPADLDAAIERLKAKKT